MNLNPLIMTIKPGDRCLKKLIYTLDRQLGTYGLDNSERRKRTKGKQHRKETTKDKQKR